MPRALPRSFFARDADVVARELLGQRLVHMTPEGRVAIRIVETEAYFGPVGRNPHLATRLDMPARLRGRLLRDGDPASHSYSGPTARNSLMFGRPGFAYVYLIYGMYECLNVVTGPAKAHEPQAVLLRGGEPVEGIDAMISRRRVARVEDVASGPGKLTRALGVTRAQNGADITKGALRFEADAPITRVDATARIGVVGAEDLKLRYVARGSQYASRRA